MKKTWAVMGTAVAVSAMIFTGCGSNNTTTGTDTTQESENTDTAAPEKMAVLCNFPADLLSFPSLSAPPLQCTAAQINDQDQYK